MSKQKNWFYKVYLRDTMEPIKLSREEGLKLLYIRSEGKQGRIRISETYPELDTNRIVLIEKVFEANKNGAIQYKKLNSKEEELLKKLNQGESQKLLQ